MPQNYSQLEKALYFFSLILLCGGIGYIVACLPDILEPASNPHHRKIFHSLLALGVFIVVTAKTENPLLKTLAASYTSHLILDGLTPFGLPLI